MSASAEQPPEVRRLKWTPELIRRFWDYESRHADHYFTDQFGAGIAISARSHLASAEEALDYGCGAGGLLGHILKAGPSVTGLDDSAESVAAANARFAGVRGFKGAFIPPELPRRGFDVVTCCEVIEHLDDEALSQVLDDIRSLLAPGGRVILTTPNQEDLTENEVFCPNCCVVFHRWQHVRSWSPPTVTERLRAHGFGVIEIHATNFAAHWSVNKRAFISQLVRRLLRRPAYSPHLMIVASVAELP